MATIEDPAGLESTRALAKAEQDLTAARTQVESLERRNRQLQEAAGEADRDRQVAEDKVESLATKLDALTSVLARMHLEAEDKDKTISEQRHELVQVAAMIEKAEKTRGSR